MRRLLRTSKVYNFSGEANTLVDKGSFINSQEAYKTAISLAPENLEIKFWHVVSLVSAGRLEKARPIFADVFKENLKWKELAFRLQTIGRLPETPEVKDYLKKINT